MTKLLASAALVLALAGGTASAQADGLSQLANQAGVSPAAGLSLDTLAALNFNRSSDRDDYQTVVSSRATPGALDAAAAAHFTRNAGTEAAQGYRGEPRMIIAVGARQARLIKSAAFDGAEGRSLDELAAVKFAGEDHEY